MDHFWHKDVPVEDKILRCESISVLSIGLPQAPNGEPPTISTKRSFLKWREKLVQTAMTGSDYVSAYQTRKLIEAVGGTYSRIEPMNLSPEQLKNLDMDNTSPASLKSLIAFGQSVGEDYTASRWFEIEYFFNELKSYKTKSHVEYA